MVVDVSGAVWTVVAIDGLACVGGLVEFWSRKVDVGEREEVGEGGG